MGARDGGDLHYDEFAAAERDWIYEPRILIPDWLFARLTAGELEQIVLHEAEHLRRRDDWTNLLQKICLALFPLNPALVWIERRLCREREMACDDGVISVTNAPRAYAACLASLAERGLERRAEALSLGAWQRRPELVHRVHSILRRKGALGPVETRVLLGALSVGLVFGAVELSRCPQLVAFVPVAHVDMTAEAVHPDARLVSAAYYPDRSARVVPATLEFRSATSVSRADVRPVKTMNVGAPVERTEGGQNDVRAINTSFSESAQRRPATVKADLKADAAGAKSEVVEQQWIVLTSWVQETEQVQPATESNSLSADYDAPANPTSPGDAHAAFGSAAVARAAAKQDHCDAAHFESLASRRENPTGRHHGNARWLAGASTLVSNLNQQIQPNGEKTMTASTNSLVVKAKRAAVPVGAVAAVLALGFAFNHGVAHAAIGAAAPMDESSVSSLTALDNAVEAVAARVTPAVVNVSVTLRGHSDDSQQDSDDSGIPPNALPPGFQQFFFGPQGHMRGQRQPEQMEHGIGSGIIISPDGYIVTNDHVVDGATQIRVTLNDRRVFPAKLIGVDKLNDLAVIRIDAKDLTSIAWGDSTRLHPGQTVLAFGSPFGYFQFSVTRGIVSALDRPNPYSDDPRKPGDFIQTDAAINPGNSGGPLVDARGELIGINTFIISGSGSFAGAGFAIPSQIVRASAEQLIKNGSVHHGYLGISMNDVTPDNASFFNLPDATGAIVSQVTPDSPAGHAGLKAGDVLREIDGRKIVNGGALQVAVSEMSPGNTIALGILRDGKPETIKATVGEFHADKEVAENSDSGSESHGKLGLSVDDLTPDLRSQLNIPEHVNGAAIESVRPGSPADDAGLAPGDVITEVDRHPVENASSAVNQLHSVPAGKDVLLLVWSKGGASYRVVHPAQDAQNGM